MPAKKQDVAPEEMAPQAEEMVTPEDASPQTDSENEKPGATRARKAKKATEKSESDTEPENESPGSEGESIPKRKRSYTRPTMNVLSIDERLAVETDADKAKNDLLDLIESMKTKRILTGTIQGVERPEDNPNRSLAVIYHGDFKVIIPAEEAVEPPEDFRGRSESDIMHYMLTKRLGAEVDYIVKGIDP